MLFLWFIFREIPVLSQRVKQSRYFVLPLALIIMCQVNQHVEYTGFLTALTTVTQPTVILSPSLVLHGPWWCPGRTSFVHWPNSKRSRLSSTLQWTRMPITGICTAWVWHEWGRCKVTPLIGEQRAASQPMASISQTTSAVTSRISTSLNILVWASAGKWSTWTSADTRASTSPHASGKLLTR